MELDREDLKTKLDKVLEQRRKRLGESAELAGEGPPLFLQAARQEADRLGLTLEELLRRDAEYLRESRYPGPDCLRPEEVEAFDDLPAERQAHVRSCPSCDALLAAVAVPPPFPQEPAVEEARRREPHSAWQPWLSSWVPAAPPRWATAFAAGALGVVAVLLSWLLRTGTHAFAGPQIVVEVSRSTLAGESGWPGVACAEVVSSLLDDDDDNKMTVVPWDLAARLALSSGSRRPQGDGHETFVRCAGNASRSSAVHLQVSIEQDGKVREENFPVAGKAASVFDVAFDAGQWVRKELGVEGLPAKSKELYRYSLPSDHEAARLYSLGLAKLWRFRRPQEAIDLLLQATRREAYPLAYQALSEAFSQLGDAGQQRKSAVAAYQSADRYELPEHERLILEGKRWEAAANWPQAVQSYDKLERISPAPFEAVILAAEAHLATSDARSALEKIEELRDEKLAPIQAARLALVEASAAEILSEPTRQRDAALRAVKAGGALGAGSLEARGNLMAGKALRDLADPGAGGRFDDALRLFRGAGDVQGIADVLREQGVSAQNADDIARAESLFQEALADYRAFGDRGGEAKVEIDLGHLDADMKNIANAREHYQRALQIYRVLGNEQGMARALTSRGILLWHEEGDFPAAIGFLGEALRLNEKISYRGGAAYVLANLGQLRFEQGQLREAREALERCLAIREEIGLRRGEAIVHTVLAEVLAYEDDLANAERHLESALAIAGTQLESPSLVAEIRLHRAEVWMEQGRLNEALPEIQYVLKNSPRLQPAAAAALADLFLRQRDLTNGWKALNEIRNPDADSRLHCKVEILKAEAETAAGKPAQAVTRLKHLLEQIRAEDLVLFDLEARLALAQAFQGLGQRQAAQEQLRQVSDTATEMGALLLARKAESLADRAPRKSSLSALFSLPLLRSLRSFS